MYQGDPPKPERVVHAHHARAAVRHDEAAHPQVPREAAQARDALGPQELGLAGDRLAPRYRGLGQRFEVRRREAIESQAEERLAQDLEEAVKKLPRKP